MVEWVKGIYHWVLANQQGIVTVITSAEFAAVVSLIVLLIRQIKKVAGNTDNAKLLNGTVTTLQEKLGELKLVTDAMEKVKAELLATQNRVISMNNSLLNVEKQLSLFFDAQSVVYSTHRNEDTRANLLRIIGEAKALCEQVETPTEVKDVVETAPTVEVTEPVKTTEKKTTKNKKSVENVTRS